MCFRLFLSTSFLKTEPVSFVEVFSRPFTRKSRKHSLQPTITHFLNENDNDMLDENEMKEEKDYFFPETLILETASTSASKMVTNTSPKGNADTSKGVETSKRHINIHDKRVLCPFCDQEITNFSRHLLRKHKNEEEVKQIASYEKLSKERLSLIELLRKRGNFIDLARGNIRPVKRPKDHADLAEYSACLYCHGLYKKKFIYKHSKKCKFNKGSCL